MDTPGKSVFLNLYSINLRGLASRNRGQSIIKELQYSRYNVFFLQETHIYNVDQKNKIDKIWKGQTYWDFGDPFARRVVILIKEKLPARCSFGSNERRRKIHNFRLFYR
jgi:hypothetical protein